MCPPTPTDSWTLPQHICGARLDNRVGGEVQNCQYTSLGSQCPQYLFHVIFIIGMTCTIIKSINLMVISFHVKSIEKKSPKLTTCDDSLIFFVVVHQL